MSQQEFVPQSQQSQGPRPEGQQSLSDDEIYYPQHPYNWSTGENKAGPPRDEPPSSYEEVIIQRGYQAQDRAANTRRQEQAHKSSADSRSGWRQQLSPDGDAYEESYRAYRQYDRCRGAPGCDWGYYRHSPPRDCLTHHLCGRYREHHSHRFPRCFLAETHALSLRLLPSLVRW